MMVKAKAPPHPPLLPVKKEIEEEKNMQNEKKRNVTTCNFVILPQFIFRCWTSVTIRYS